MDPPPSIGQSSEEASKNNSNENLHEDPLDVKIKDLGRRLCIENQRMNNAYLPVYNAQLYQDPIAMSIREMGRRLYLDEQQRHAPIIASDSERASPPLYEVELTASDEDDDASVLELVIPMKNSKYQRVPTSSPKKAKPKVVKRYFCGLLCCVRSRK